MSHPRFRRKNVMIKRSFQTKFAARFCILVLLEVLIMVMLLGAMTSGTLTSGFRGAEFRIEKTSEFFMNAIVLAGLAAGVLMWLIGMLMFVLFSHRLAGPLYRLEKSLETIRGGDLTHRVNLRKTDELGALAAELDRLTQTLNDRVVQMKNAAADAEKYTQPSDISKLREILKRLEAIADTFKTSS